MACLVCLTALTPRETSTDGTLLLSCGHQLHASCLHLCIKDAPACEWRCPACRKPVLGPGLLTRGGADLPPVLAGREFAPPGGDGTPAASSSSMLNAAEAFFSASRRALGSSGGGTPRARDTRVGRLLARAFVSVYCSLALRVVMEPAGPSLRARALRLAAALAYVCASLVAGTVFLRLLLTALSDGACFATLALVGDRSARVDCTAVRMDGWVVTLVFLAVGAYAAHAVATLFQLEPVKRLHELDRWALPAVALVFGCAVAYSLLITLMRFLFLAAGAYMTAPRGGGAAAIK